MNSENIIALVWDFDKTLIPGNMQEPLFSKYKVNPDIFWKEVDCLKEYYSKFNIHINQESIYLNHILTYVNEGIFKDLNNEELFILGSKLNFCPGIPDFFVKIKADIESRFGREVLIENYVVSTGLRMMIKGSLIEPFLDGYWGSEFIESVASPGYQSLTKHDVRTSGVIQQVGFAFDNTSKTKALFEINKGVNKGWAKNVNIRLDKDSRRIPFENIIYIADGESDIPAFSVVKSNGGSCYGVYPRNNNSVYKTVSGLLSDKRIDHFGEANFMEGSETYTWLLQKTIEVAERLLMNHFSFKD